MDLRSIKLRLADRHARVVVADARGERGADLEGERFDRVAKVAAPLVAAVEAKCGGRARAISVDTVERVLRVSLVGGAGGPGRSFVGPDYEALVGTLPDVARAALLEIHRRPDLPPGTPSEAHFWDEVYRRGADGWELGRAGPPLERWFTHHLPASRRALVVGCGRGHEARLLARLGARVVAIDLSSEAIEAARAIDGSGSVEYRIADLFAAPQQAERYDLIVEHCCFCAIEPRRRPEYVAAMADALVDGGELVGLFWAHGRPGGPPFSVTPDELSALFSTRFIVEELAPASGSVASRQGQEIFGRFRLRGPSPSE